MTTLRSSLVLRPAPETDDESASRRRAARVLDEDHYGLDKVKERILEFLAVRRLKPDGRSPVASWD